MVAFAPLSTASHATARHLACHTHLQKRIQQHSRIGATIARVNVARCISVPNCMQQLTAALPSILAASVHIRGFCIDSKHLCIRVETNVKDWCNRYVCSLPCLPHTGQQLHLIKQTYPHPLGRTTSNLPFISGESQSCMLCAATLHCTAAIDDTNEHMQPAIGCQPLL